MGFTQFLCGWNEPQSEGALVEGIGRYRIQDTAVVEVRWDWVTWC